MQPPSQQNPPSPPDALQKQEHRVSPKDRVQHRACVMVLELPDGLTDAFFERITRTAENLVKQLAPEHATEASMRCRLAVQEFAEKLRPDIESWVKRVDGYLEAEARRIAAADEKLDKPAESAILS